VERKEEVYCVIQCIWLNKRRYDDTKWVNIPKPFTIEEYNLRTHDADRANQNVSYCQYNPKQDGTRKYFITLWNFVSKMRISFMNNVVRKIP